MCGRFDEVYLEVYLVPRGDTPCSVCASNITECCEEAIGMELLGVFGAEESGGVWGRRVATTVSIPARPGDKEVRWA